MAEIVYRISLTSILGTSSPCSNLDLFEKIFEPKVIKESKELLVLMYLLSFNYELRYCIGGLSSDEKNLLKEKYTTHLENFCSC